MKKWMTIALCACLAVSVTACSQHGDVKAPEISQSQSATESVTEPNNNSAANSSNGPVTESSSSFEDDTGAVLAKPSEGTIRFNFTVSYLSEEAESEEPLEKSAIFSFDLPKDWDIKGTPFHNTLYNGGLLIGQIEMHPRVADTEPLFSDIDTIRFDTYSTKEMTVSGYPAKCFVIKSSAEGTDETNPTYSYYIAADDIRDAYVNIFFLPVVGIDAAGSDFDSIVSSFLLVG